ncbi:PadR family transcriptional regulator [soil metagenome]
MPEAKVTTTGYIILGMLCSRDWSAYELAEQVGRGLDQLWSRADRQRYETPKRLAELGLITARQEPNGKRRRTVYSITDAGHEALAEWLATDPAAVALQFEGGVRVLLADQGTIEDLRRTLETIRTQAQETRTLFAAHAQIIHDGAGGTFPERQHLSALMNRFMVGHAEHLIDWSSWALEHSSTWTDTVTPAVDDVDRTREVLRQVTSNEPR